MPVLKWALRVRILKEYGGLPKVDFLEQELEGAEALLKLPSEKADSISEWKNSDSELSDQDNLY